MLAVNRYLADSIAVTVSQVVDFPGGVERGRPENIRPRH
jgi:hypothetical protein